MITAGIMGATGYTGLELLKLLQHHPAVEIGWLTSENSAGQRFGDVFAVPPALARLPLISFAQAQPGAVDVVFCCLPHAAAQAPVAAAHTAGAKVVDLSADFRLHDAGTYQGWYGVTHTQKELLAQAVYGLPELHRAEIRAASVVANPGCYPTSIILGLAPLARAGWLAGSVIADSKSGISGAGRSPSLKTHFVEASENFSPYSIGRAHRHLAEMEQELGALSDAAQPVLAGYHVHGGDGGAIRAATPGAASEGATPAPRRDWQLIFSPHLLPLNRGILSTIYVALPEGVSEPAVRESYRAMYDGEPFVNLLPAGQVATLSHSVNTNYCVLALTFVPGTRTLIVTASIDNLVKGASGQAIQNMNLMFGMDETTALL